MQLTIISKKLDSLTTDEFIHELRVVHASKTRTMARTLGIITRYIQGLRLPPANTTLLRYLPIQATDPSVDSMAQLTWPSLTVLQGALSTDAYLKSAGSHVFALPVKVYVTEKISPDPEPANERDFHNGVRVVVGLSPLSQQTFPQAWSEHAAFCHSICPQYQRHRLIPLDAKKVHAVFGHTQFTPKTVVVGSGGYEDFVFRSLADAEAFFEDYGADIRASYARFVDQERSFSYVFDNGVQYCPAERGVREVIVGVFVGLVLTVEVVLNL
ncbi:hypothetical protein BO78DRAFT_419848 [Aspergillus sclerotiicarbonarius CBS 121057]|uniref:EthD domain-containing protein n=1 Tax=Aspergillus sclerotiicarbonarius (strain CBS 121057 / IBT 28362) TaxID=1448318 RepID=A0A319EUH2_ASPSB|nr:hypothetical protein BO78DRAFT_419848 [Aspergillus sclerotiicarbonarius CBS 121057]